MLHWPPILWLLSNVSSGKQFLNISVLNLRGKHKNLNLRLSLSSKILYHLDDTQIPLRCFGASMFRYKEKSKIQAPSAGFHPSNSKSLFTQAKLETRPFNSQKWLIFIISLKYLYIIQQTGDENTHTYQVEFVILI